VDTVNACALRSVDGRAPTEFRTARRRKDETRRTRVLFKRNKLNVPPPRPPDLPFDEAARDALGAATGQAQNVHASAIHAEHLLLALLADPAGLPTRALQRLGQDVDVIRRRIEHASPSRPWGVRAPVLPYADDAKGAIEFAMREARAAGLLQVGVGQLLLGVLQSPAGVPRRALAHLDITPVALRSAIAAESGASGSTDEPGAAGE
jgi:ATP-dependent Clp protease ATP-binding subunit ClpA